MSTISNKPSSGLNPPWIDKSLRSNLRKAFQETGAKIIVLDDDPTGTQTVHNTNVLLTWSEKQLVQEISSDEPVLYLLTNSRSLQEIQAIQLGRSTGSMLLKASAKTSKKLILISRSDSTLRGHYPAEVDALATGMELKYPLHVLVPAFIEGGRYTLDDVHYVEDKNELIPVGKTEFARDETFGFTSSNLFQWVIEKHRGSISKEEIGSITLDQLRRKNVVRTGLSLPPTSDKRVLIVNAAHDQDMEVFARAFFHQLLGKRDIIFRSAASIVPILAGMNPQVTVSADSLIKDSINRCGGLVVVGSYVGKTTEQLSVLLHAHAENAFEIEVDRLLDETNCENYQQVLSQSISEKLNRNKLVVAYTSRRLRKGRTASESLQVGRKVANGLNKIIRLIEARPRFFVAKGGITSCEMARDCLGANRVRVIGAIRPGIPVWRLEDASLHPSLPFIVFPGNVGKETTLLNVTNELADAFALEID